jgi:hypothetical protein
LAAQGLAGSGLLVELLAGSADGTSSATAGAGLKTAAADPLCFSGGGGGRESASATTLAWPDVCRRSEVNSAKKERCLC